MRSAIFFLSTYFLLLSSFSCSLLGKKEEEAQAPPPIEGEGADDIFQPDMDKDPLGSDSGNIEGLRTVYFALDSSHLTEEVKETLQANKSWLDQNLEVQRILLEGHCDPLGSEAYNIGLGQRRAQSVFDYLQSVGLSADRMSIISYGEEKPISFGDNSLNRRVNFVPQY